MMTSRDRVRRTIRHEPVDRIPLYGWVKANMSEPITRVFGSVAAFEDHYEFDYAHLFGGPSPVDWHALQALGSTPTPEEYLQFPLPNPDNSDAFADLTAQIAHHQHDRGRFVYVQTPGIFEALNGVFGIEDHLAYLLTDTECLREVYRRQMTWNRRFAHNCLDLGVDMIHVSDDWGGQHELLFSPRVWWEMIFPFHQPTCTAVKERGAFISLHSDGNVSSILDGIVQLGYDVVHPFQESAGMNYAHYQTGYADKFILMGGLDVQTTLGFGRLDFLQAEITRVLQTFADGGLLFCTTHFVQDHCTIEELILAYDTAYRWVRAAKGQR
jgi:uroporphyrinogen decarboxylase